MHYLNSSKLVGAVLSISAAAAAVGQQAGPPTITVVQTEGRFEVMIGDEPFAAYVYEDEKIKRPYWTAVHAPNGVQVTRNHPPVEGQDRMDHETMHPGIWLGFGDISGVDFWRNKGQVTHQGLVVEPKTGPGYALFTVENAYMDGETLICREMCRYTIRTDELGTFLLMESTFMNEQAAFVFGDQEEMGLGARVATPMAVINGGTLTNSEGGTNEAEVWGKPATWCDYSGEIDGARAGICIMPNPGNFRPSWFHARDYGFFAANPFGRNAMTGGETSAIEVKPGETFQLGYGVFLYSAATPEPGLPEKGYARFLELTEKP
jgi:hypothetical protein